MLKLILAAFHDGWAFVRDEQEVWLLRPPYRRETMTLANDATFQRALLDPGFEPVDREFATWAELIELLRQTLVERSPRRAPEEKAAGRALLPYASVEVLQRYLDRVERELIPAKSWLSAQEILVALIATERARSDEALHRRAATLLERCTEALGDHQSARAAIGAEADKDAKRQRFPFLAKTQDLDAAVDLGLRLKEQRQILRPAA